MVTSRKRNNGRSRPPTRHSLQFEAAVSVLSEEVTRLYIEMTVDQILLPRSEADRRLNKIAVDLAVFLNDPEARLQPVAGQLAQLDRQVQRMKSGYRIPNNMIVMSSEMHGRWGESDSDALTEAVGQATHALRRFSWMLPGRRRAAVRETERDLLLAEATVDEIDHRRRFESQDLLADAVRSRLGLNPEASPRAVGVAVLIIIAVAGVLGVDITAHLDISAHVGGLQSSAGPVLGGVAALGVAGALRYAYRWVRRRRRIS